MKIAVIDLETTGFMPKGLIVEIGISELDLETGEVVLIYDKLVKEDGLNESHRSSWIFQNSTLSFDDVMKADPLDKETIQNILNQYPQTAFNKKFDFAFMKDRGFELNELPCAMYSASPVCECKNKNGGKKAPNVQEAWNFFFPDSDYIELHRGGDDSFHEAKIVYELYKRDAFKIV